jgi:exosortase/archaeosortase family protein
MRSSRFRFAAAFGLSCLGFHALVCALPPSFAKPLCDHTARTLAQVLDALGIPALTIDNIVSGGHPPLQIVLECTALFMVGLFTCFVSLYPGDVRKKAAGLAMGIPALYLGNIVRLTAIYVVSRYSPGLFGLVHVYVGQVFTMFLVILACILWLKWVNPDPGGGPGSRVLSLLARFALISGCMFFFWMEVHHWYIWLIDRLMIVGFSLFGYRLFVPQETAVYYETFSIVTFTSLILATRVPWARKGTALAAGLSLFFLLHLFHRTNITLMSAFGFTSLLQPDLFFCDIGQYLLPVLLWLAMATRRSSSRARDEMYGGRGDVRSK